MKSHHFPRKDSNCFSSQQLLLTDDQEALQDFIGLPFSEENLNTQTTIKSTFFTVEKRNLLVSVLSKKYSSVANVSASLKNIASLENENCFTITTGHQLSLLTGPLYFIYKILHVIKQCELLNEKFPEKKFVPVYWMASEDHDFEEVKSFLLYGKTISWESEQAGAVGRMNLFGLSTVVDQIKQFFVNHPESEIHQLIDKLNGNTYGEAFFQFVHELFGSFGLVILDGDEEAFKTAFKPLFKQELTTQFSHKEVVKTNEKLASKNFKIQVHPREINLFFLSENKRERIIANGTDFQIGENNFTSNEILDLLEKYPASFSPNVVLRPLYQEFILPNICYVGGVGELSYWLQLKSTFEKAAIPYPIIQARSSVIWIDKNNKEKLDQLHFEIDSIFKSTPDLKKEFLLNNEEETIEFTLQDFQFNQFKSDLIHKSEMIDPSVKSWIEAEFTRIEKQVDGIKNRLEKSVKSKHEKALRSIEQLKEKLFPSNGMQERSFNFFQFCPDGNYKNKLQNLYTEIEPFNSSILILFED
jgi:bacillithiol biosynthesis cysteine-adding enzyme BshC